MKDIGLEPGRLKMVQLSSAMGSKFAEEAQRMTDEMRSLGPSPLQAVRIAKAEYTIQPTARLPRPKG